MTILAVLVMSKYTLTDAMHARILAEIQDRRKNAEGSASTAAAGENPSTPDAAVLRSGGATPPGPASH
jgi:glucuronide carrier protein